MESGSLWYVLPAAFLLDLILGDPGCLPHPVRWMGKWIETWEPWFRNLPIALPASGCAFALSLVAGTWLAVSCLLAAAELLHPFLETSLQILLIYYALSVRSLGSAAMEVYRPLRRGDLEAARAKLALIVGRDVKPLDARGVTRGAVETVAENFVDGVLSPLFFAALGGAPLAIAYKMINTLDSTVGYRNERYADFGKCAARLDDAANFIPARLSVPIISLAAGMLGGSGKGAMATALKEGRHHLSPNAGLPEAAFAGALGVRLGGPNYYGGRLVAKPWVGSRFEGPAVGHIERACRLMVLSALISLVPAALYAAF